MKRLLSLLVLAALWAPAATALADDYVDFDPSKATPTINTPLFVILAYSAIWIAAVGFTVILWRRQRRISEELDDARRRLTELGHEGAE